MHVVFILGPRRKLQGRFLHITDMHPDPYYRVGMSPNSACHRRKPKKAKPRAGEYGLPYGCVLFVSIAYSQANLGHVSCFLCLLSFRVLMTSVANVILRSRSQTTRSTSLTRSGALTSISSFVCLHRFLLFPLYLPLLPFASLIVIPATLSSFAWCQWVLESLADRT